VTDCLERNKKYEETCRQADISACFLLLIGDYQILDPAAYFLYQKKTLFLKRGTSNEKMANSDHHPNFTAY
jgi:hypothetical protein